MEKHNRTLLIDDMRDFNCDKTVKTFEEGIKALQEEIWDIVYLDHDLGLGKTGYDIVCWLENNKQFLPKKIILVTQNPVGRKNMEVVINKLYKEFKYVYPYDENGPLFDWPLC